MRKPNSTFLWMLTFILFVPLAALADPTAPAAPTVVMDIKDMTPAQRKQMLEKYDAEQTSLSGVAFTNTLKTTTSMTKEQAEALRKTVKTETPAAVDTAAPSKIAKDVETWDALSNLIIGLKFAEPDRASKDQSYASGVHLEGLIPKKCA